VDDVALIIEVNGANLRLTRLLVDYQKVIMYKPFCFAWPGREFRPALADDNPFIQVVGKCGPSGYPLAGLSGNRARPTSNQDLQFIQYIHDLSPGNVVTTSLA
jgi:hypothetical protein